MLKTGGEGQGKNKEMAFQRTRSMNTTGVSV
jgi:hypothetical protein